MKRTKDQTRSNHSLGPLRGGRDSVYIIWPVVLDYGFVLGMRRSETFDSFTAVIVTPEDGCGYAFIALDHNNPMRFSRNVVITKFFSK